MLKRDIIEDLAVLLRGFFATPMISSLGRLGVLDKMGAADNFRLNDFPEIPNHLLLEDTIRYFVRIGLVDHVPGQDGTYKANELGKEIFRRANSFYVPHSYFQYMARYHDLITHPDGAIQCEVERLENVIGSGKTHLRYFPPTVSFLKRKVEFDVLADIGCGDGQFLSTFLGSVPGKKVVGVDLSKLSTEATASNLRAQFPQQEITVVCSDALDVPKWSKEVLRVAAGGKVALSMWFLLHEISRSKPQNLVNFFRQVHAVFPASAIVVGEVVRQSDAILAKNNAKSLMPEYLFFHEMSRQGILSWDEYRGLLKEIAYELVFERVFDESPDESGKKEPSTFVWALMPK